MEQGVAIVVDIGKTHSRISLWSDKGICLERLSRANLTKAGAPYPALDIAATTDWLIEGLSRFAGHPVQAIIPVTHGAAIAGIRGDDIAFAPPDYEWEPPGDVAADYRRSRDPFAVTGSPALPCGLNIGSQLHYLEWLDPDVFSGVTLMPYAQYWAWLLSGVAVSEVTSLGCHSDLWSPALGQFSAMAQQRGWAGKFAPLAGAGDVLGTLRPEIAQRTGLSATTSIHAGLHDSNAALLAARAFPEIGGKEATVLSTGTWFVAMRSPAEGVDLAALEGDRDCLVNVDAFGQPVPSSRFMGGREIELLGERIDQPGTAGAGDVLYSGAMVLPAHVPGCGPFPGCTGRWINRPDAQDEREAAIALYAALMADTSLDLIGSRDVLLIEGRFAASEIFTRALAALRPTTAVYTANAEADVSFGALRLILPQLAPQSALSRVEPLDGDLAGYRAEWLDDIAAFA